KTTPLPPAGFTISQYVPPTPAEQAAELVKTKQPKEMSFAEWELVLSAGKPEDAEKVWNAIKGVPLQMEGQVIKASDKELQIVACVRSYRQSNPWLGSGFWSAAHATRPARSPRTCASWAPT